MQEIHGWKLAIILITRYIMVYHASLTLAALQMAVQISTQVTKDTNLRRRKIKLQLPEPELFGGAQGPGLQNNFTWKLQGCFAVRSANQK